MIIITIKDYSMSPFLQPDDEVEFEPGCPVPNGRICLVKIGIKSEYGRYYRKANGVCETRKIVLVTLLTNNSKSLKISGDIHCLGGVNIEMDIFIVKP